MTHVEILDRPVHRRGLRFQSYEGVNKVAFVLRSIGHISLPNDDEEYDSVQRTPVEANLREVQEAISDFSMHLPRGFAQGLSKQFANMLDEDDWEEDDQLIDLDALNTFLVMLHEVSPQRRPGIGTDGHGSVTAFWRSNENRLTANCLSSGQIAWVLTRANIPGDKERAAGNCQPSRLTAVLAPYSPEIWFDQ